MAQQKHFMVLLVLLTCLISSSYAYQFYVGGRDGWVTNPSEKYNNWAEQMRFQVNDTLLFKYKKGSDSVLVVNKDDYDKCNTNNPIKKMDDGNSTFKFVHSGPFFFISGNKDDCDKGQKLIIVVLAIRPPPPSTPTSPTTPSHGPVASPPKSTPVPAPVSHEPPTSSPVNAPTPSTTPSISPSTSPATSPTTSPSASPSTSPTASPSTSHAPSGNSPSSSPAPAKTSPSPSPSGAITSPSPSSSGSSSPTSSPPAPSTAEKSPPGSISPAASGDTPADINSPKGSPPNTKNSAVKAFTTPSAVVFVLVSTLLTIAFGGFIV